MKKFSFRLETLLRVRRNRIKVLQKELGSVRKKWECVQEEGKSLATEISRAESEISQVRFKGDLLAEHNYEHFLNHLKDRKQRLQTHLEKIHRELFQKQNQVAEAIQGRKIIEKIKEKQYVHWQHKNEKLSEDEHTFRGYYQE